MSFGVYLSFVLTLVVISSVSAADEDTTVSITTQKQITTPRPAVPTTASIPVTTPTLEEGKVTCDV